MTVEQTPSQGAPGQSSGSNPGSSASSASSASSEHYRRCCEHPPYCGPMPPYCDPYCDPYCGPRPSYGRHHHGRRHRGWHHYGFPPVPGSEFFEAMMQFASSAAGSRSGWWQRMADATRYARRDYMCGDPYYDSCAPYPPYCDPCAPSYCDPCAPSYCDPCAPSYCDPCAPSACDPCAPDSIDLKALKGYLGVAVDIKLAPKRKEVSDLGATLAALGGKSDPDSKKEHEEVAKKLADATRELMTETAKAEAETDAVIHAVKLSRVAEAMRRKQWSRGSGRRY
jgi:hypothetical protein